MQNGRRRRHDKQQLKKAYRDISFFMTDGACYDMGEVGARAKLVVDSRGATRGLKGNSIVRLESDTVPNKLNFDEIGDPASHRNKLNNSTNAINYSLITPIHIHPAPGA